MDYIEHDDEPTTSPIVASENESNKRKRRSSQSDEPNQDIKRFMVNSNLGPNSHLKTTNKTTNNNDDEDVSKLLELSDEMLLKILHSCDGTTLYAVSK